jgi:hypothetical protein
MDGAGMAKQCWRAPHWCDMCRLCCVKAGRRSARPTCGSGGAAYDSNPEPLAYGSRRSQATRPVARVRECCLIVALRSRGDPRGRAVDESRRPRPRTSSPKTQPCAAPRSSPWGRSLPPGAQLGVQGDERICLQLGECNVFGVVGLGPPQLLGEVPRPSPLTTGKRAVSGLTVRGVGVVADMA